MLVTATAFTLTQNCNTDFRIRIKKKHKGMFSSYYFGGGAINVNTELGRNKLTLVLKKKIRISQFFFIVYCDTYYKIKVDSTLLVHWGRY